jgi:hypothetical protein
MTVTYHRGHRGNRNAAVAKKESKLVKPCYRQVPDPGELNCRMWRDAESHIRFGIDPATRDAYVKVIPKTLMDQKIGNISRLACHPRRVATKDTSHHRRGRR